MTTLELLILLDNLVRGLASIEPGEPVTLRGYLHSRVPELADEITARLTAREFVLWVDGQGLTDVGRPVVLTPTSQLAFIRLGSDGLDVVTAGHPWN